MLFDTGKNICYYFPNWGIYARKYPVKEIPIDKVPEIAYAFFNVVKNSQGFYVPKSGDEWADFNIRYTSAETGIAPLDSWNTETPGQYYGCFGQFRRLRESGKLKNLGLSIGGWTWSAHFSEAVRTPESRKAFIDELINIFNKYNIFNKVNIDWEYISPENNNYGNGGNIVHKDDPKNFVEFLRMLRERLNSDGKSHYKISGALIGAPEKMDALPVEAMIPWLDEWHIMTYDYDSSAWGQTKASHQTNLRKTDYTKYSIEESVDAYLKRGVPAHRIYIGVAFYSRGFANTDGLGKPSNGIVSDQTWEAGVCDYKDLPRPGAVEYYDAKAGGAYSYDPVKKILNSYDNPQSVVEKCKYVWDKGLKGVIVWDISGDVRDQTSNRSLIKVLYENLMVKDPRGGSSISNPAFLPQPVPVPQPIPVVIPTPPTPTPAPTQSSSPVVVPVVDVGIPVDVPPTAPAPAQSSSPVPVSQCDCNSNTEYELDLSLNFTNTSNVSVKGTMKKIKEN